MIYPLSSLKRTRLFGNLILLPLALLALWVPQVSCASQSLKKPVKEKKPNIIVILIDDAGYADFGFMGSKDLKTPEIDKLAQSGTIFTDAHVSSTVCAPSRAGLISGRYQQRFGFECNGTGEGMGIDPEEITLAAALKTANYKTVAIGKWHLGEKTEYYPNSRGFDEFYGFLGGSRAYFYEPQKDDKPGDIRNILHNHQQVEFKGYLTDEFGDAAVNYIEKFRDSPFFMYLTFNAVHTPMHAKEADLKRFEGHARQKLAAMTWSLDENVGKVIKKLEEENILENTLIFFLSDNGGATNNQSICFPLKGFKGNEFEGGHRVPFLVSWKGHLAPGGRNDQLTSSLDIYATSLAAAGLKAPESKPLDGVNLIPFIKGSEKGAPHPALFWRKNKDAAARIGELKLIRLKDYGSVFYDLKSDLSEQNDLTRSKPAKSEELHRALKDWEKNMIEPLWTESEMWIGITFGIHKALMSNENPRK